MRHVQNLECAEVAKHALPFELAQVKFALIYLLFLILNSIKKNQEPYILQYFSMYVSNSTKGNSISKQNEILTFFSSRI